MKGIWHHHLQLMCHIPIIGDARGSASERTHVQQPFRPDLFQTVEQSDLDVWTL
jgi:hypothetical protein